MALESIPPPNPKRPEPDEKRMRWQNCVESQTVEPLLYVKPQTLQELVDKVNYARKNECKIKAVGSGHSFSDITQTADMLMNCHGMNRPIELETDLLHDAETLARRGHATKHLVHVENGMRIREVNKYLDGKGLALLNMGGYDAQTIAGVVSTSTHGTGIGLGPIASSVASIIMVGEEGNLMRIEPREGITNPDKYKKRYPGSELEQNDETFNAVLVSMGCMGIVYSFILKVTDAFYLSEERIGKKDEKCWEDLRKPGRIRAMLADADTRHLEIWVNPYKTAGNHNCLVTKRKVFTGDYPGLPWRRRYRNWFTEEMLLLFRAWPPRLFKWFHKHTPKLIDMSIRGVLDLDGYVDKSYEVMHLGNANYVKGYAAEYAVSLKDDLFVKAVDRILELAEQNREVGKIYHTAPVSLRFVKRSDAFLSMMHGEDKCLIEVPLLKDTKGRFQILDKIEHELLELGDIRPHWGQYHNLGKDTIIKLYPELKRWLKVYNRMNQTGIFRNTFTDRCGFDPPGTEEERAVRMQQPMGNLQ